MIVTAVGFTGMLMILIAFFMNQTHRWKADSVIYDAFNSVGGLLMVVYAFAIQSWPFLVLNAIWTIVSVRDVVMDLQRERARDVHLGHKKGAQPQSILINFPINYMN